MAGGLKSDDLSVVASAFHDGNTMFGQASTDFGAMKLDDPQLSTLSKDLASYLHDMQVEMASADDIVRRIVGAKAKVDEVAKRSGSDAQAVVDYCKPNQTAECHVALDWIVHFPDEPGPERDEALKRGRTIQVRDATLKPRFERIRTNFEELDASVRAAGDAGRDFDAWRKRNGSPDARGDELEQRLSKLCGRPVSP